MAKWGEGDPRWIVEDRPDATNVNNWHWVEKDATNWSKNRLKELLKGLKLEHEIGTCEITDITSIEGEATANNRKAKLIFFYEFEIKGEWSGILTDDVKKYKGKFVIPNLSEENDASEVDVNVTADKTCDEAYKLKEIVRVQGQEKIREKLAEYMKDLKSEYGQNIILPTKDASNKSSAPTAKIKENKSKEELNKFVTLDINSKSAKTGTLTVTETFQCPSTDLYRALTYRPMVEAYMGSDIKFEAAKGESFTLAGGNIVGEFLELIPNQKLVQKWRQKSWPAEHYSQVTIELCDKGAETKLKLTQQNVPENFIEATREGWKENYWNRMRQIFGFGGRLF